jgi:CBS-domain-containing membrane protein
MTADIAILSDLQVRDIMQNSVVAVSADADLARAATLMHEHGAGCLAVVDEQGRCVGMLSASDIVSRFADVAGSCRPLAGDDFTLTQSGPYGSLLLDATPQDIVRCRMSRAVQSVAGDMPVVEAAQCMCAARLHHLVVLDESSRPIGIVSSLDMLNAIAKHFADSEPCGLRSNTISTQEPK